MTAVYLTIDTEYSSGLAAKLGVHAREEVFARSIDGYTREGAVGIGFQMDVMADHGIKGVFFVDPDRARLTVDWLTPARSATSIDVTARGLVLSLLDMRERLSPLSLP